MAEAVRADLKVRRYAARAALKVRGYVDAGRPGADRGVRVPRHAALARGARDLYSGWR